MTTGCGIVRRTGDVTIATDFGFPRSTARGWLGAVPAVVVSPGCGGPQRAGTPTGDLDAGGDGSRSSRRCSASCWPCCRPQDSPCRASGCPKDAPRRGSSAPSKRPAHASRCARFSRSSACRRAGSMPGVGGRRRVRSTISLPARRTAPHQLTAPEVRAIGAMVTSPDYGMSRRARSPSSRSSSGRSGPPHQPGTTWCGSTAGDAPGSVCIRRSPR